MTVAGEQISNLLFHLIYNNIYSQSSERISRAVINRFIGFRSELEFVELCRANDRKVFSGGCFLPLRSGQPTLSAPIYFTFDFKEPEYYRELYSIMAKMELSKLIYITILPSEEWTTMDFFGIEFLVPVFKCYDFQNNEFKDTSEFADKLSFLTNHYTPKASFTQNLKPDSKLMTTCQKLIKNYDNLDLLGLYLTRLIFDGFIGFNHYRGVPSDIDCIVMGNDGNFRLYEVKEKDLSKTNPIGFGIDVQRFNDCLNISNKLKLPYYYMVRHINNQNDRRLIGWKYISFEEFNLKMNINDIKDGQTGMNTIGDGTNPTYMLAQEHFYILKS